MRGFKEKIADYISYDLEKKELILGIIYGSICILAVSFLFYNSLLPAIVMSPYIFIFLKGVERDRLRKINRLKNVQFKDGMLAISASLGAGYSVENSFREALSELRSLYGENALMVREFNEIVNKLAVNKNIEDALEEMAVRLELEDAVYFAQVFRVAKRSGGNLIEIIRKTSGNISDKMEVLEDIEVLISGKKMEQKIMNLMPFAIIAYLKIGALEFLQPLYGNIFGICVMSICLVAYLVAKQISEKIVNITV